MFKNNPEVAALSLSVDNNKLILNEKNYQFNNGQEGGANIDSS